MDTTWTTTMIVAMLRNIFKSPYFDITAELDTIHTVRQPIVIQTSGNSSSKTPTDGYSIAKGPEGLDSDR